MATNSKHASDALSIYSRSFFERVKFKLAAGFLFSMAAFILLGFCSSAGGLSAADESRYSNANDDYTRGATSAAGSGEAFASFCFILGFTMLVSAAVYVSPWCTGSVIERRTLCQPMELVQEENSKV